MTYEEARDALISLCARNQFGFCDNSCKEGWDKCPISRAKEALDKRAKAERPSNAVRVEYVGKDGKANCGNCSHYVGRYCTQTKREVRYCKYCGAPLIWEVE